MISLRILILLAFLLPSTLFGQFNFSPFKNEKIYPKDIKTGAERTDLYLHMIKGKTVAVVTNQTGTIGKRHLVDSLLSLGIEIKKVMSPEHGFRGDAAAGEHVKSGIDVKTGIPIVSLYGSHRKPTKEDLAEIDIVIFDIQDVGVRFYTYISTLHYLMEACAENNKPLIILDRPNPNGHYVDGPVLKKEFKSFVGMDPIPVVHGMTIGEYALMLNGEKWLENGIQCNLTVISVLKYDHTKLYQLPIPPSPNLPNMASIYLYPSLCFFEGTPISVGRGTEKPFQIYGHPKLKKYEIVFIPKSIEGKAPNPKLEGDSCKGYDLSDFGKAILPNLNIIYLFWLQDTYNELDNKANFFTPFFDKLAGTDELKKQIIKGVPMEEIKASWQKDLDNFLLIRKKYLLYTDFN